MPEVCFRLNVQVLLVGLFGMHMVVVILLVHERAGGALLAGSVVGTG